MRNPNPNTAALNDEVRSDTPASIGFSTRVCGFCNRTHPVPNDFAGDEFFNFHHFPSTISSSFHLITRNSHTVNKIPCAPWVNDGVKQGECVGHPPCIMCQRMGIDAEECRSGKIQDGFGKRVDEEGDRDGGRNGKPDDKRIIGNEFSGACWEA